MDPFKKLFTFYLFFLFQFCLVYPLPVVDSGNLLENENLLNAAAAAKAVPEVPAAPVAPAPVAAAPSPVAVAAPAKSAAAPASLLSLVQPSVVNVGGPGMTQTQISAISLNTDGFSTSFNTNVVSTSKVLMPATTTISLIPTTLSVEDSVIASTNLIVKSNNQKGSMLTSRISASTITVRPSNDAKGKSTSKANNGGKSNDEAAGITVTTSQKQDQMSKIMAIANYAMIIPMVAPLITIFDHGSSTLTTGYITTQVATTLNDPCSYVALVAGGKASEGSKEDYSSAIKACSAKGGISMVTQTQNQPKSIEIQTITVHSSKP